LLFLDLLRENFAFNIRKIAPEDASDWTRLRCELWPDGQADHASEIALFFTAKLPDVADVLVAEDATGSMIGFAELSIRADLPALAGTRVGYVEGLYVIPDARGCGVTRALLLASRDWARKQKCEAFGSDRADRLIIDKRFGVG
jgi:aminoglycoside 6'-N-acetyltransferase I